MWSGVCPGVWIARSSESPSRSREFSAIDSCVYLAGDLNGRWIGTRNRAARAFAPDTWSWCVWVSITRSIRSPSPEASRRNTPGSSVGSTTAATPDPGSPIRYDMHPVSIRGIWRTITPSLQAHVHGLHAGVEVHRVDSLLVPEGGLLEPAERGLRERDRVLVDVHHPRLESARHAEGSLEVLRPDPRHESIVRRVRLGDDLVDVREVERAEDRAEDLLPGDLHRRFHVREHGREDEVPVLQVRGLRPLPADEEGRAFLRARLHVLQHGRLLLAGDDGAHLRVLLRPGAELHPLDVLGELVEEVIADRLVDEEAAAGPAHLARVLERAEQDALQGPVELRVREHDLRVLPPELERHRRHMAGRELHDLLPRVRGPRERHRVDVRMPRERAPRRGPRSRYDVEDPRAEPNRRRELRDLQGTERGQGGGLQDDRVPRREGGCDPATREDERVVPWGDVAGDAHGLPQGVVEAGPGDRDRGAFDLVGEPRVVLEELVHVRDVALRLADRLADVQRFDAGELLELVSERLAELEQEAAPLARVDPPPFRVVESGAGRMDRRGHVVLGPARAPRDWPVRGGGAGL